MRRTGEAPHLLHVFSTFVPAGPEIRTVRIINALGKAFRHSILAVDGRTSAREQLDPDAPARVIEAPPRAGTPRTVRALRRLFGEQRPDLVLTYNWGAFDGVIAARSMRLPLIHHEDGFTSEESAGFKKRRELMRRWVLPGARRVVVPSDVLRRIALERWRLKEKKLLLIPNGVDLERFRPGAGARELRAGLGIPEEALVVGAVGHLRPEKNPVRLIEALATIAGELPVHALLLGEGPERAAVEACAARTGIEGRVHLLGHQAETAPWYRAMDFFALPSDTEQMPVALLEAMASGLAVASTDVGDVARILPEEQRECLVRLEPEGAAGRLGAAIERLAGAPDLRRALGRANRARVEQRYASAGMIHAYHTLYVAALGDPRVQEPTRP